MLPSRPPPGLPPLPQIRYETFARVRPESVRNGHPRDAAGIEGAIGPWQRFDGRLWLGKTFYDAEGMTGVGGFGYFDSGTRRYTIYSPPEIVDWSVSAILVEPDAVWLGLHRRGEYGDTPGGLLRWRRETHEAGKYSLGSIIDGILRHDGRLYLATSEGAGIVRDDRVDELLIDVTANGRYEVALRRAASRLN